MVPLLLAGGIWFYNAVRIAQIRSGNNRIKKRDSDDEKTRNLTIYKDCNFHYVDKRTYNSYHNCTFNYYIIKKGEGDE